jgi:hypothetical protein
MAHTSFKALGPVPRGIETVVQGFLLAIGPEGTLLMPALRAYPKTHWNHDGLSFRAGQGGCSGGNTQGGLSPEQTTPPDAKRHATRCGHGVFCPAVAFLAGGQDRCGHWPPARALRTGQTPPCHGPVGFRIGSYSRRLFFGVDLWSV